MRRLLFAPQSFDAAAKMILCFYLILSASAFSGALYSETYVKPEFRRPAPIRENYEAKTLFRKIVNYLIRKIYWNQEVRIWLILELRRRENTHEYWRATLEHLLRLTVKKQCDKRLRKNKVIQQCGAVNHAVGCHVTMMLCVVVVFCSYFIWLRRCLASLMNLSWV